MQSNSPMSSNKERLEKTKAESRNKLLKYLVFITIQFLITYLVTTHQGTLGSSWTFSSRIVRKEVDKNHWNIGRQALFSIFMVWMK